MKNQDNTPLIAAILFATAIIAGSVIFLGTQVASGTSGGNFEEKIQEGIEAYIEAQMNPEVDIEGDPMLGDPDALVTIVEFSDYECPYCGSFYNGALPQIKEAYIDTGKANLVYKDFPLSIHSNAAPAANAAECAYEQGDDELYFEYHDKLFSGSDLSRETYISYAESLDLNVDKFTACLDDNRYSEEISADMQEGARVGVSGTPGFVINGTLLEGAQPFSNFETVIESKLSES